MRKVYVEIKVRAIIEMDENVTISDVISDMDYSMDSQTDGAIIVDTEILDYEVKDSK